MGGPMCAPQPLLTGTDTGVRLLDEGASFTGDSQHLSVRYLPLCPRWPGDGFCRQPPDSEDGVPVTVTDRMRTR